MKQIVIVVPMLLLAYFSYGQNCNNIKNANTDTLKHKPTVKTNLIDNSKNEDLVIKDFTKENSTIQNGFEISWDNLLSGFFGALIGLFPYFIETFRRRKLYGKIISTTLGFERTSSFVVDGNKKTICGLTLLYKINLVANKDINIRNVKVYVEYDNQYFEAQIFFIKGVYPTINPNDYLQITSRIKSNESCLKYLSFIVDKNIYNPLTKIPQINDKIAHLLDLSASENLEIEKVCHPKKIKVVLFDFKGRETTLTLDLNKHLDVYSIVPEEL